MTDHLKITNSDREWQPKYFAAIVGIFCGLYVTTNAMNSKLIEVAGIVLPAGILAFPVCCIITDLMTEIYGFNRTRQAIWTVLACTLLYALFTTVAIYLPAPPFWQNQASYEAIFGTSWRMALAGCTAWLAGEFLNSFIVSKMKILQNAKHMGLRFIGSTAAGQFADTIVFASIAFLGTMPFAAFCKLVVSVWIVKVLYEVVALPLSIPVTNWMKRLEGVEHFDRQDISVI